MTSLIIMTIALSIGISVMLYIFNRNKVESVFVAIFGISAAIPIFFHFQYDFGYAWLIWIISLLVIISFLFKKYPKKMKEWGKHFQ
jgi:hypothetical protein